MNNKGTLEGINWVDLLINEDWAVIEDLFFDGFIC